MSDLACPRCGAHVEQEYYGPCSSCREELRAAFLKAPAAGDPAGHDSVVVRFEPRANVVANHVAASRNDT